jgi:hypothetical protein
MNFDLVKYLIEVGHADATAVSSVGSVAELASKSSKILKYIEGVLGKKSITKKT